MFESSNGNTDIQKTHINDKGFYVITAGTTNNGILGKTDIEAKVFTKNTITIDMFGFVFFRNFEYKMVTHARVFSLKTKNKITEKQGLFLSSSLYFLNKKFGYENMCSWEKVKQEKIQLPTKNNQIDFDFMENFIAELEAERVAELEAYLSVSGLKDYELTEEEKRVLRDFESNKIEFGSFEIAELFEIKSSKKRFDANKITISDKGSPYVVRTNLNNGIRGYINEDIKFLNESNTISFGQDTATMFYQKNQYFTGDKIKILQNKLKYFNSLNAMFFITSMSKSFSSFSWGASSFNVNILSKQNIITPTKNSQPDYKTMETFISAIQKLVIKDVVLYSEKKLNTTKKVVNFAIKK